MRYFVQINYRTDKGITLRYTTVEAASNVEAAFLVKSELNEELIVDMSVIEIQKNIFKSR